MAFSPGLTRPFLVLGLVTCVAACGNVGQSLPEPVSVPPATVPAATTSTTTAPTPTLPTSPTLHLIDDASTPGGGTAAIAGTVGTAWVNQTDGLVGLESECGNLNMVSTRPDRDMVIASVAQRGLWSMQNGAEKWAALGTGAGSATITNRGSNIIYDPDHLDTFWEAGIYNDGGVYRTDDNGVTFRQLGDVKDSEAVSVDLADPARKTLLTSKHEATNVYRSSDGGATWVDISGSLPAGTGFSTGPVVIDPQTFLLGTSKGPAAGIFRTTDAGQTWNRVLPTGVIGLPLRATEDGALYWILEKSGGIVKSTDQGLTWKLTTSAGVISPQATSLLELPDGRFATVGNGIVILSDDQGTTWQSVGPAMPVAPSGMTYSTFRKAFYVWHLDCDFTTKDPIQPNTIMRLDFDPNPA